MVSALSEEYQVDMRYSTMSVVAGSVANQEKVLDVPKLLGKLNSPELCLTFWRRNYFFSFSTPCI